MIPQDERQVTEEILVFDGQRHARWHDNVLADDVRGFTDRERCILRQRAAMELLQPGGRGLGRAGGAGDRCSAEQEAHNGQYEEHLSVHPVSFPSAV